jgi:hypothetical protein
METIVKISCAVLFLTLCTSLSAQEKSIPKEMYGKWSFVLDDGNGGSMQGTCVIALEGEETKAAFDLGMGGATKSSAFRFNDQGVILADFNVEGYPLLLTFKLEEGVLMCDLDVGAMVIPIDMKRAE